jgi:23S rRNA pseudouridine1911/1915/1917 synthase
VVNARFDQLTASPDAAAPAPQDIPLDVVHEDADVLVVNKPAGLVTHPAPGHWDGTLVNAILWHLQQTGPSAGRSDTGRLRDHGSAASAAEPRRALPRAGIVHRLDKDTSGLLLVAKTETAHHLLSKQLKSRAMHRRYLAVVEGQLSLDTGTVSAAIGRHHVHRKEMAVRHVGGRVAVTHYRALARSIVQGPAPADGAGKRVALPCTLVEVSLETGRTHQIRVHMAHLGHPVVGDLTYGRHPAEFWASIGVHRQLLHAYALQCVHPATRKPIQFRAPLPEDFRRWVAADTRLKSLLNSPMLNA